MNLLHTATLEIKSFEFAAEIPPYAILSHRWEDEEVTYQDMVPSRARGERMKGFAKIRFCAAVAKKQGFTWCWVDSCCIDKTNYPALSESINSMYRWYQKSQVCYVYLSDVPSPTGKHKSFLSALMEKGSDSDSVLDLMEEYDEKNSDFKKWIEKFKGSRWFTRGWTLQELIAPRTVEFYAQDMQLIGTKESLVHYISEVTLIDIDIMSRPEPERLARIPVACRMSWAAGRTTTKKEDMAYCLLGIFNVRMPLLYGEGEYAFIRLQREIIADSDDKSIFLWRDPSASFSSIRSSLADSPVAFKDCSEVGKAIERDTFRMTNGGLKITLPLVARPRYQREFIAILPGLTFPRWGEDHHGPFVCGIYLAEVKNNTFVRVDPDRIWTAKEKDAPATISRGKIFITSPIHAPLQSLNPARANALWLFNIARHKYRFMPEGHMDLVGKKPFISLGRRRAFAEPKKSILRFESRSDKKQVCWAMDYSKLIRRLNHGFLRAHLNEVGEVFFVEGAHGQRALELGRDDYTAWDIMVFLDYREGELFLQLRFGFGE